VKKICFVTVVHRKIELYLVDFFNSLREQSFKSFELILFNDALDENVLIKLSVGLNVEIIDVKGSPNEIRNEMILFLIRSDFEHCIFGDADDFFPKNRIKENISLLDISDIVVNDVHLVNQKGDLIQKNYFSNRLENGSLIDFNTILDKNILGLGNTAIRTSILTKRLLVNSNILAVDWQVFSRLLLVYKSKTIFTNNTAIYYRQYDGNMIGLDKLNLEKVKFIVNVKIEHFKSLSNFGKIFKDKLNTYSKLKTYLLNNENCNEYLDKLNEIESPCFFWWEEVKPFDEFNYESTNNSK
jgi:hypothetical protein